MYSLLGPRTMLGRISRAVLFAPLVFTGSIPVFAQLRPEQTPAPKKAPAKKSKPKTVSPPPTKPEPEKPPSPTQVVIQTSPGAEGYLDDQFVGRAGPEGRLVIAKPAPGSHKLRVSLAGKKNFEQNVEVVAGETAQVTATLADLPGRIVVRTSPGAEVYLDNQRRGSTDATGQLVVADVAPGSYDVKVSAAGKQEWKQSVAVLAGQAAEVSAALASTAPEPGASRVNSKDGLKYVWIPPGTFQMGCSPGDSECISDEKPSHQVTISRGFWMAQTEVTVGAYKRFASTTGHQMPDAPSLTDGWTNDNMPIVNVNWDDAQAFCQWAGGRLPTEAEWEYAARGGSTEARYGPIDEVAWYRSNSGGGTHPVGEKRANTFGLFDTLGNVWEWVSDWYDSGYYATSTAVDPSGPASGTQRVLSGGSWLNGPGNSRVSGRGRGSPGYRLSLGGLRCVREVGSP